MNWKIKDRELTIGRMPLVMGILNVTPDSFSDGGKFDSYDKAMKQAEKLISEGASIIDVGGESTRPGATEVSADEEIARVVPVIEGIVKNFDVAISVDTYKAETSEASLRSGAHIINDVYGFLREPEIAPIVASYKAGAVVMSNATMRQDPNEDIMTFTDNYLKRSLDLCKEAGISDEYILVDPGVGFGTTREEDTRLIREFSYGDNTLLGVSRKRIIAHLLDRETTAGERASGSVGIALFGAMKGAKVLRVHDVRETYDALLTFTAMLEG